MNGDHGISFFHLLHFKTKHYFKYTDVFKNLKLNFKPIESDPNESNINITFNVWKPSPSFSKRLHHHQIFNYVLLIHPKYRFLKTSTNTKIILPIVTTTITTTTTKAKSFKKTKPSTKMESKRDIRARRYAERQAKLDKQLQLKMNIIDYVMIVLKMGVNQLL